MTTADPTPVRKSRRLSLQELVERAGASVLRFRRVRPVSFKGVSRDVVVYEAVRS
jgi:hypothetical protein